MSNANLRDFYNITQDHMEPFQLFVKRLKIQAEKCPFPDPDLMIKNQIIDRCFQDKLKRRALQTEMTLDELISTGIKLGERYTREIAKDCTRCGSKQHVSHYSQCPALFIKCGTCKKVGHFTALCKFKRNERKRTDISYSKDDHSKRPRKDGSEEVPRAKYDFNGEGRMPKRDLNGESSKQKNEWNDEVSVSIGTNVTTKKPVSIKLVGRSIGKSQDDRKEFDVEAFVSDKYLVNVISYDLLDKLKDMNFLDYSSEMVPMDIAGTQFLGVFTTMVKVKNISMCSQIFIIKQSENFVTITRRLAKSLKLLKETE